MTLDKDIENLLNDGFEGSINENRIFIEVFFGNDQGKTSKKCVVTGAINFARDKSRPVDLLSYQNCETSAISNQLNVSDGNGLKENSGPRFSSNGQTSSTKDDNVANGKRIKLNPDEQPVFNSVTCRLVESTSQGITSSCYLLKGDISMHSLPSFHENNVKEFSACKTIASSVSQESSANKSQILRTRRKRIVKSDVDNLTRDNSSSHKDSLKSPRPLLRKYIQDLLKAAGWEITVRRKENFAKWGYIYLSPHTRKPLREFHRVWNICGQSLSIDRTLLVLEEGKQWNDMSSFWSDLFLTLGKLEEEPSLAQQWCLLDPLVNLVFIEKKLGLLKVGEVVEARSSLVIDSQMNKGATISSKKRDIIGDGSKKGSPGGLCESSLVGASTLTNTEAKNSVCMDSCGTRITVDFGQLNRGTVKALNGVPVSLSEEKCTPSRTTNGFNLNSIQANDLDGNSDHSSSCINEVPITPQNGLVGLAESVSPSQDGTTRSPVSCRYMSYQNVETDSEVDRTLQVGTSGRRVRSGSVDAEFLLEDRNIKTAQAQNADKSSAACQIESDDHFISAVIIKKTSSSLAKKSPHKTKVYKSKPGRKPKTQKGSCRLLPRSLKHNEKKPFIIGSRTVLSWLISSGIVSLKEVIQYRILKDNTVAKEGLITRDGILCKCCNSVFTVSSFKFHAGFRLNGPCLNLVMASGKSFTLCQLEAWFNEYKTRKSATRPVSVEDLDQNDDSCGLCGDGGELICCDNCPSTFHRKCLSEQELPEGNWYCKHCTCRICGDLVVDKEAAVSTGALKCSQCDRKYHAACLKDNFICQDMSSKTWFCGESCQEVYLGLQSHVGVLNCLSDGYTRTLLRCIHGDQKVYSAQRFVALKAECNSKLAVALTIMEECFLSMVDARTGIDMIPHVLYNWGSEFARLNYNGFYTMVLEKDDVLISVASVRIHGVTVAEMPLIATCSKFRRQGMCRRLMNSIEEMLRSFKVEKLVITAIPDLVETWTHGFGFEPLQDDERKSLSHVNLMVFPGTVWLKKTMYKKHTVEQTSSDYAAPFCKEDEAKISLCSDGVLTVEIENRRTEDDMRCNALQENYTKMPCDESGLAEGQSQLQIVGEGEFTKMSVSCEVESALST